MSGSRRFNVSRRGLWLGGALLLLCGSAVGAVVTNVITQRFTATVIGSDGVTYEIEGVLQIEDDGSGAWMTDATGSIPEGEYPRSGTLTLEDGSTVTLGASEGSAETKGSTPK